MTQLVINNHTSVTKELESAGTPLVSTSTLSGALHLISLWRYCPERTYDRIDKKMKMNTGGDLLRNKRPRVASLGPYVW